jgi:hypothetical protein
MSDPGREPSATENLNHPASPVSARGWFARLALILFVGLGLWVWKDGRLFAREREISWQTPDDRSALRKVEIQILGPAGDVLKREEFFFRDGAPPHLSQRLVLKNGGYRAMVFTQRAGEATQQFTERELSISNDDAFTFPLEARSLTR